MSGSIYSGTPGPETRAGVVSAFIGAEAIDVAGEATYDVTQFKRETLVGQSGVQGHSKMPKASKISFNVRDDKSLSVQEFNQMDSVTVILHLANGKTVTGYNMWEASDGIEVNTVEGTFKVNFEGRLVVES